MKHALRYVLTICFIVLFFSTSAATGVLSGMLADVAGKPIVMANVLLLKASDSQLVKNELTGEKGEFSFSPAVEGDYLVCISSLGYNSYISNVIHLGVTDVQLPAIVLPTAGHELKEVAVRGQKPMVEVHADKLVLNVENSIVSAGGTVMDILSRAPGVVVDQNDNLSLKGKSGVTVMVNGKIQPIGGQDLANMLKNMPANAVENIELISNPGARYDAAGTAGIINIKTKKDKKIGLNGSVQGSYIQGVYPKATGGFNMNFRNKKLNLFANYNGAYREGFNHLTLNRNFYNNGIFSGAYLQDNNYLYHIRSSAGGLGLDYNINSRTVIGFAANADGTYMRRDGNNQSDIIDSATLKPLTHFVTANSSPNIWNSGSININLRHNFDSAGRQLAVDIDAAAFPSIGRQDYTTTYFNYLPSGTSVPSATPPAIRHGDLEGITRIRSLKVDYTDPLKNGARLDAGFKVSYVTADNDLHFYNVENSEYILDAGRTNHFVYTENINAAYLNYNRDWPQWSTQLGLRAEQTIAQGKDITIDSTFNRNYTQLFPSFAVQRHLNQMHDLGATLSRRIERPNYEQLNPFKYYLDPTTYKSGYPYLNPSLSYSVELSHIYKQRFVTSFNYSLANNPITEVIQPSTTEQKVTIQTTKNLTSMEYVGVSGSYQWQIKKWWSNTYNFNAYYARYKGDIAGTSLNKGRATFDVNTTNSFILPGNWSAEVSFFYQAPQVYGYMNLKPTSMLSAGIQKNFWDKRATIKLNITDIYWRGYPRATSNYNDYVESFVAQRDTRQASLTFSYRFGKRNVPAARRRNGGAEEEKRRVGQGNS